MNTLMVTPPSSAAKRHAKWWWAGLLLCGVVAGGVVWHGQRPLSQPARYSTAKVEVGNLVQAVTASGQLNPVIKVLVGSQISGTIQKLFVDFNSLVTNSQVIAQLDPATYLAAVHQNEGELKNARAALELAQLNAARAQTLYSNAVIPGVDYDTATIALHQAEATIEIKQGALEKSQVDLARCTIYSPVDGMVIARNVDVGQTVAASLQAPTLFEIANSLQQMQIDAFVSEADIGAVEVGQEVVFTVDAFPNRNFRGKVAQVRNAATVVQNVVTYDTVIEVNNQDLKLRPGMTANVSIIVAQRPKALKIPNAAFRYRPPDAPELSTTAPPGTKTIFVLSGPELSTGSKRPLAMPVKPGITDGIATEILEGIKEGDEVIISAAASASAVDMSRVNNPIAGTPPRPPGPK